MNMKKWIIFWILIIIVTGLVILLSIKLTNKKDYDSSLKNEVIKENWTIHADNFTFLGSRWLRGNSDCKTNFSDNLTISYQIVNPHLNCEANCKVSDSLYFEDYSAQISYQPGIITTYTAKNITCAANNYSANLKIFTNFAELTIELNSKHQNFCSQSLNGTHNFEICCEKGICDTYYSTNEFCLNNVTFASSC